MASSNTRVTTKNVKKGILIIVVGLVIVVIGLSLTAQPQSALTVVGWILDIFGVLVGLSGFGYLVGLLGHYK
ncbi:MAG TPA: hypothetical protein VFH06_03330 [Candidatus Saccharimonadales bacterium]|nr:hypothetical protein [Candidatus Saccharimonadales bacterium]